MQELTPDGQAVVNDLAARHGFSTDAVTHMLVAVLNGNGGMAQFSHGEFGGSGQWMRGGMLMLGDMFNGHLKGRVQSLCNDIANLLANQPGLLRQGSFQSQGQGGSDHQHQASGDHRGSRRYGWRRRRTTRAHKRGARRQGHSPGPQVAGHGRTIPNQLR